MNSTSKNQQIEFEVFPKDNKSNYAYLSGIQGDAREEQTQINVVFSHQSVIIVFICAIMLLVASFSLGVEKGKLISKNSVVQEKQLSENQPLAPAAAIAEAKQAVNTQEKISTAQALPQATPVAGGLSAQKETIETKIVANVAQSDANAAGSYTIQIASVKSESAAKGLAEVLTKKGVSSFTRSSGKYTIILAGNFAKKEEAQQSLKELKKTYTDCFIRKI